MSSTIGCEELIARQRFIHPAHGGFPPAATSRSRSRRCALESPTDRPRPHAQKWFDDM